MKTNPRHYILIVFSLLSIMATSSVYFLIYKQAINNAKQYATVKKELESEDSRKQGEQELLKIYNSTKESRNKILSFLVNEDKIVGFIESVEKIGTDSKTDLELSSINNDGEKIKAKVSAKGSWVGVMTTLALIENLPLSLSIKNVRLNIVGEAQKTARLWELSLDIEALSIK